MDAEPKRRWYRWLPLVLAVVAVSGGWLALNWESKSDKWGPTEKRIIKKPDLDEEIEWITDDQSTPR